MVKTYRICLDTFVNGILSCGRLVSRFFAFDHFKGTCFQPEYKKCGVVIGKG